MIVVAIIVMITAVASPNFLKSRQIARTQVCIQNLTKIESAKQMWAMQAGKKNGDLATPADLVGPLLFLKTAPECPAGGTYDYLTVGQSVTCTEQTHSL